MWLSLPFLCRLLQRGRIPQLLALAHFDHYCTYNENRISLAKSRHSSFTQKNKAVVDVDGTTEKEHEYLQYPSLSAETPFLFPPFFFLLVTGPVLRYQVSRMRTSIQHGGPPLPTGSSIGRIPLSVTSHDDVTPTGKESVPVGEMKQRLGGDPPTTGDGGGRGTKNKGGQEEARKAAPFSRYAKQGEREKFRRPVLGRLFQRACVPLRHVSPLCGNGALRRLGASAALRGEHGGACSFHTLGSPDFLRAGLVHASRARFALENSAVCPFFGSLYWSAESPRCQAMRS